MQTFYESIFLEMGIPITYMAFVIDHEGQYSYPEFDAAFWKAAEAPGGHFPIIRQRRSSSRRARQLIWLTRAYSIPRSSASERRRP